jgi:hypothetical protein
MNFRGVVVIQGKPMPLDLAANGVVIALAGEGAKAIEQSLPAITFKGINYATLSPLQGIANGKIELQIDPEETIFSYTIRLDLHALLVSSLALAVGLLMVTLRLQGGSIIATFGGALLALTILYSLILRFWFVHWLRKACVEIVRRE